MWKAQVLASNYDYFFKDNYVIHMLITDRTVHNLHAKGRTTNIRILFLAEFFFQLYAVHTNFVLSTMVAVIFFQNLPIPLPSKVT